MTTPSSKNKEAMSPVLQKALSYAKISKREARIYLEGATDGLLMAKQITSLPLEVSHKTMTEHDDPDRQTEFQKKFGEKLTIWDNTQR